MTLIETLSYMPKSPCNCCSYIYVFINIEQTLNFAEVHASITSVIPMPYRLDFETVLRTTFSQGCLTCLSIGTQSCVFSRRKQTPVFKRIQILKGENGISSGCIDCFHTIILLPLWVPTVLLFISAEFC